MVLSGLLTFTFTQYRKMKSAHGVAPFVCVPSLLRAILILLVWVEAL
jgi:hypothetical protein